MLGSKIERQDSRAIPGTVPVAGQEVIYFSDDGINPPNVQFRNVTRRINPPLPSSGGASEGGCDIHLPDGLLFRAIFYHGDTENWKRQIEFGAKDLNLLTAIISDNKLLISDGRKIPLSECTIEFK